MAIPIIGSSFDEIARQQQFWGQFNQRQEEANIGRYQQAQQERNAYLRQLAMDRQAAINADTARAYEEANVNATLAQQAKEAAMQERLSRQQMATRLEEHRIVHANDLAQERRQLETVASWASANAPKSMLLTKTLADAKKEYQDSTRELLDATAIAKSDPDVELDKSGFAKLRTNSTLSEDYPQLVNRRLLQLQSRSEQAQARAQDAYRQLQDLQAMANKLQITINSDGTMSSALHVGRTFGGETTAPANPLTAGVAPQEPPPPPPPTAGTATSPLIRPGSFVPGMTFTPEMQPGALNRTITAANQAAPVRFRGPTITWNDFRAAIDNSETTKEGKRYRTQLALKSIAEQLASRAGPAPESALLQRGSSPFFKSPGSLYYEALTQGKSSLLPGLTAGRVGDYLESLAPEEQSAIFETAMKAAGIGTTPTQTAVGKYVITPAG